MSIGFIGASAGIRRSNDVFSGNAGSQIDTSLQNVLGKYDQIKTDLDRLTDSAQLGTYNITNRQYYGTYDKDSGNGWAETWYSEYRAVLALRADALQKQLSAAYNRVLDRSTYAEINSNKDSIFAPYANRTINGADVTYRTPVSEVLLKDVDSVTTIPPTIAPPTNPPVDWRQEIRDNVRPGDTSHEADLQREATIKAVEDYLASTPQTETPDQEEEIAQAAIQTANSMMGISTPASTFPGASTPTTTAPTTAPPGAADNIAPYGNGLQYSSTGTSVIGTTVSPPPSTATGTEVWYNTANARFEIRNFTEGAPPGNGYYPGDFRYDPSAISNGFVFGITPVYGTSNPLDTTTLYTPPTAPNTINQSAHGYALPQNYYIDSWGTYDIQVPNSSGYWMPRTGVDYPYIGAPGSASGTITGTPAPGTTTWQNQNGIYTTVRQQIEQGFNAGNTTNTNPGDPNMPGQPTFPPAPGYVPATPGSASQVTYGSEYDNSAPGGIRNIIPMFGVADVLASLPSDIRDTLTQNSDSMTALTEGLSQIENSFVGRQFDDIFKGNEYDGDYVQTSMMIYPMLDTPATTAYIGPAETAFNAATGGSFFEVGSANLSTGIYSPFGVGVGPDLHFGHLSAISGVGGFPAVPDIGLAGGHFTIPIPIPFVGILYLTGMFNVSYDFMAKAMHDFLDAIKKPVVETLQTQAYAASSGTAFDTYASRAEYHFTEPGLYQELDGMNLNVMGIPIPIGSAIKTVLDYITGGAGTMNDVSEKDSVLGNVHSVQGAESRETETGAFFATNAFLSQFEMNNMDSEYWIGTQQNEESVNMDLTRAMMTGGREFLTLAIDALVNASGIVPTDGFSVEKALLIEAVKSYADSAAADTMFSLLYGDNDTKGTLLNGFGGKSHFKEEGYNYIEYDHKPFEGDSDFNYKANSGGLPTPLDLFMGAGVFDNSTPNAILEGYASSLRYRPMTAGGSGQGEDISMADWSSGISDPFSANGIGARAYAGNESLAPGKGNGIWSDTPLGDINEVYVGTRKISFSNLSSGFGQFSNLTDAIGLSSSVAGATINDTHQDVTIGSVDGSATRTVSSEATRYIGADTRAVGRRYDAADPINFETFNSGLYSDTYGGGVAHYDRRNDYSLSFTTSADSANVATGQKTINLFGSQALNPTFGGFIKMQTIDKNKNDTALLKYENIDLNTKQQATTGQANRVANMGAYDSNNQYFGAAADETLNEVNQILYEHMHLRADGRNLSTVKEYRDVFNMGLMNNVFISGQSYHPSGGGITSTIQLKFDNTTGRTDVQAGTREDFDASSLSYDPYNTPFLNKSRGVATIYLDSYFAYKKRAANNKT